jgi:hypothetical protein
MVRFGQWSTKLLSTWTSPGDKIGGNLGNCLTKVLWLCRRLESSDGDKVPELNTLLRRCRALKGTIATPLLLPWSRLNGRRFAVGAQ